MELYKKEFGQDFDLGFGLKNHPYLVDKSWHNDQCPSFYFKIGEQYYLLWVDYADEEQREENTPRYAVVRANNEGSDEEPELYTNSNDVLFESNSYVNLSEFLSLKDLAK